MPQDVKPPVHPEVYFSESVFSGIELGTEVLREEDRTNPGPLESGAEPKRAAPEVVADATAPSSEQRRRVRWRP